MAGDADFATVSSGLWSARTVVPASTFWVLPLKVSCTVAVFAIEPASTSAWVTV